jgi:hypothetical protein
LTRPALKGITIMTKTATYHSAIAALLLATSPAHAGPCAQTIASVQAQLDAAIENRVGADGWKPESLNALRGYQPTPSSLAAAEGGNGRLFAYALDALDRARAADSTGDSTKCDQELDKARVALHQ